MLKLASLILKTGLFALVILIIGNLVEWKGRTLSDQVKTSMAHAESSDWFDQALTQARSWAITLHLDTQKAQEHLSRSERKQLRKLIED